MFTSNLKCVYVLWSSGMRMIWCAVVTALPDSAVVVGCCSLGQATPCFVTPHLQKMGLCTISLEAAVLPGLKSGRALVKKKKMGFDHTLRSSQQCCWVFLRYDAVSLEESFPEFRRIIVPSSSGSCSGTTAARQHERRASMYVIPVVPHRSYIQIAWQLTACWTPKCLQRHGCTNDSSVRGCDTGWFLDSSGSTVTCCLRLNCTFKMEAVSSPKRSYVGLYTSPHGASVQTADCTNCLQSAFSDSVSMPKASIWCTCRDRYAMQCALSAPPPPS
jgi:hypothetical protein